MARTWTELNELCSGPKGTALSPTERIAYEIMEDLDGRSGLTDCLDDDIKDDIFESFVRIIDRK